MKIFFQMSNRFENGAGSDNSYGVVRITTDGIVTTAIYI